MVNDSLETNGTRLLPKSRGSRVLTFHRNGILIFNKGPAYTVIPGASRRVCVNEHISALKEER